MATSKVAIELWERIIDLAGLESDRSSPIEYYPTILACCLVCQEWLPRSRYNLYRKVRITDRTPSDPNPPKVYRLSQTIAQQPHLAALIAELHVVPTPDVTTLSPFARFVGPTSREKKLIGLHTLNLRGIRWHFARLYNSAISHLPGIRHLHLQDMSFDSASDLFRLIWSLPHLEDLTLHQIRFVRKLSEAECERLRSSRPSSACQNLRTLSISSDLANQAHFPPAGAFGDSVVTLSLEFSWKSWHRTHLSDCLSSFKGLKAISMKLFLGDGEDPHIDQSDFFTTLLFHLPAGALQSIKMDLVPVGSGVGSYGLGRRLRAVDIITGNRARDLPTGNLKKFTNLEMLELQLTDDLLGYDSFWWHKAVTDRLPESINRAVTVRVVVEPQDEHRPSWPHVRKRSGTSASLRSTPPSRGSTFAQTKDRASGCGEIMTENDSQIQTSS